MTQAITLMDTCWQVVGPDVLLTGALWMAAGPASMAAAEGACMMDIPAGAARACPLVNHLKEHIPTGQSRLAVTGRARAVAAVQPCLHHTCTSAGYLPSSGGLLALDQRLAAGALRQDVLESSRASSNRVAAASASAYATLPDQHGAVPFGEQANGASHARQWRRNCDSNVCPLPTMDSPAVICMTACAQTLHDGFLHLMQRSKYQGYPYGCQHCVPRRLAAELCSHGGSQIFCVQVAEFYKSWDLYGALSNFSAHSVSMPSGPVGISGALPTGPQREWPSVEHFYQAQKFSGWPGLHRLFLVVDKFHCKQRAVFPPVCG
jgi:hypothetical protein